MELLSDEGPKNMSFISTVFMGSQHDFLKCERLTKSLDSSLVSQIRMHSTLTPVRNMLEMSSKKDEFRETMYLQVTTTDVEGSEYEPLEAC